MPAIELEKLYQWAGAEVEGLAEEMYKFEHYLRDQYEIKKFLTDSLIEKSARREILDSLGRSASPLFRELLNLLLEKELWREFSSITEQLISLVEQRRKIKYVEIRTAFPLAPKEVAKVIKACGARVRYDISVDPELLGGIIIKYADGRVCDGSIRGQLEQLKLEMAR